MDHPDRRPNSRMSRRWADAIAHFGTDRVRQVGDGPWLDHRGKPGWIEAEAVTFPASVHRGAIAALAANMESASSSIHVQSRGSPR